MVKAADQKKQPPAPPAKNAKVIKKQDKLPEKKKFTVKADGKKVPTDPKEKNGKPAAVPAKAVAAKPKP